MFYSVERDKDRYRKLHIGLDTKKYYIISIMTLHIWWEGESNDINLVIYADPAGTGTYKEHVHIYNTVLWLKRCRCSYIHQMLLSVFAARSPKCIQCHLK